ncbi:MAG TPA: hypothetical protein VFH53_01490 [Phycisphaerae bacterium]|nr:hypothetical protein [Phycisphaerae bacterium]
MRRTFALAVVFVGGALVVTGFLGCSKGNGEDRERLPERERLILQKFEDNVRKRNEEARIRAERFDWEKAERVIAEIRAGRLRPSPDGEVVMPDEFSQLICDGSVYVTQYPNGGEAYLFPIWTGKGSNLQGFLRIEGAVSDLFWHRGEGTFYEAILPVGGGAPKMGEIEIVSERSTNWFCVSRTAD